MLKDETSRTEELRALGWSAEELRRYEELWDYRQRWGAINLEPEDRAFLRRAEALLPKRQKGKSAQKKSLQEKSHYRWLALHRDAMAASAAEQELAEGEIGAWRVLLEEELAVLDHYQPVLGLPDTLKARTLVERREAWIAALGEEVRLLSFNFQAPVAELKARESTSWKPLRGEANTDQSYPVLTAEAGARFRASIRQELAAAIRETFPSLQDSAKPAPAAP